MKQAANSLHRIGGLQRRTLPSQVASPYKHTGLNMGSQRVDPRRESQCAPTSYETHVGPVPPQVYRPQPMPKVLQRKIIAGRQASAGSLAGHSAGPVAPPVYRPQSVPKVLQRKFVAGQANAGRADLYACLGGLSSQIGRMVHSNSPSRQTPDAHNHADTGRATNHPEQYNHGDTI